jgi:hypothetical protein
LSARLQQAGSRKRSEKSQIAQSYLIQKRDFSSSRWTGLCRNDKIVPVNTSIETTHPSIEQVTTLPHLLDLVFNTTPISQEVGVILELTQIHYYEKLQCICTVAFGFLLSAVFLQQG